MYTYPWWLGGVKMLCNYQHLLRVRLTVRQGLVIHGAGVDWDILGGGDFFSLFILSLFLG